MNQRVPIVGIPCDYRVAGSHPFQMVGEKYVAAVREGSDAVPLLIPALDPPLAPEELLRTVDGLLFTGSPSNVAPRHYGGPAPREGVLQDERRDATSLALLRVAIAQGAPVLCLCRGFQELNVAFGGTLHQHVHELQGRRDHREDRSAPLDVQYGPAHEIQIDEGGLLARILTGRSLSVNSLHSQGIDRLAPGLHADAFAPDGQIEAISMPDARGFVLGVQWHPEWRWAESWVSRAIFGAFGKALREALD
jgi:putative glutamine amidotransferase